MQLGPTLRAMIAAAVFLGVSTATVCLAASAAGPQSLTVADSVKLAVAQSPSVRLAQIAETEAQSALDRISADALLAGSRSAADQASDALSLAKLAIDGAKDDVAAQVEQAYYAVLLAQDVVALRGDAVTTAKQQLAAGKVREAGGLAGAADTAALADNVASAQHSLDAARRDQHIGLLKFDRAVGLPLDTPVKLTAKLDYAPAAIDLQAGTAFALANRRDLIAARFALQRRQEELKLGSDAFTPLAQQAQLALDVEKATIALGQATTDATIAVEEAFDKVKQCSEEIDNRARALARAQRAVANRQTSYKRGLSSATDLVREQASYDSAKLDRLQGVSDYVNALAAYYRTIGRQHPALAGGK